MNSNSSDQGQRGRKAPTIFDVAKSAGVSKSTVSNVLQGKPNVNGEIRASVVEAMERLGYQVHAGARFLRQRSNVLGVVAGDLSNPFDAELAAIVETGPDRAVHGVVRWRRVDLQALVADRRPRDVNFWRIRNCDQQPIEPTKSNQ